MREQGFERVQTAALSVHSLGQSVAQMHLILQEESGRRRRRSSSAGADHRRRRRRIAAVQIGIAVARTGRRCVAHVVEQDVVRRRRSGIPALEIQVQTEK